MSAFRSVTIAPAIAAAIAAAIATPDSATAQPGAAHMPHVAQVAAQVDVRRPLAATPAALVRPAAMFRFLRRDAAGLPVEVTVADSAGQLVASYQPDGGRAAHPMAVTVLNTDLVLQAETSSGLLTLRLDGQNAPVPGPVTGHWWLGAASGALRGRTR